MSLKNFKTLKVLGEGSFGVVQKALRVDDNQFYALKKVKYMDLKEKDKKNALNEIRILASIDHPNVIKYKEAFFDEDSRILCTVMQLAPNGDLAAKIKNKINKCFNFYEHEVWSIGKDMINGLYALHEKNVVHRDIKPANIFFGEEDVAKIGDLNVSVLMKHNFAYTQTGTPYYASPQVWNNQPYSFQCDIWSLGCVLYEMCSLRKPFEAKNIEKLYQKIRKLKYDPLPCRFSSDLTNVIQKCLTLRDKRISLAELKKIFQMHNPPKCESSVKNQKKQINMMDTITLPLNKKDFSICLPKPKYENPEQLEHYKSENLISDSYPILNNFIIAKKKQGQNGSYLCMPRSQKKINPFTKQVSLIQLNSPSFKQVISMNSPQKYSIKEQKMISDPLKIKRGKIQVTLGR